MPSMGKLEIKNLCFSYEESRPVIDDISLSIDKGSFVVILGHNGSGKSTLAKLIVGLLEKKSGQIFFDGEEINRKNIRNLQTKTALVFQNPDNQFIGSTVEDDIAFGLENRQFPHDKMQEEIEKFAESVNMLDYLKKEPINLSGGQKQRVALAGALILRPEILILDEATSMLDPKGKMEILNLIQSIRKENPSLTVISITHDIEEAYLSDQVIVLKDGKIILDGNPNEIFKDEEKLKETHLSIPLIYKVKNKMRERGYDVKNINTLEEAVDKLCQ